MGGDYIGDDEVVGFEGGDDVLFVVVGVEVEGYVEVEGGEGVG